MISFGGGLACCHRWEGGTQKKKEDIRMQLSNDSRKTSEDIHCSQRGREMQLSKNRTDLLISLFPMLMLAILIQKFLLLNRHGLSQDQSDVGNRVCTR